MEWKEFILIIFFGIMTIIFSLTIQSILMLSNLEKVEVSFVIEENTLKFLDSKTEKENLGLYESYLFLNNDSNIQSFCKFKDSNYIHGYIDIGTLNYVRCADSNWVWSPSYSIKEYINYLENER